MSKTSNMPYEDIIHLPHPVSARHAPMSNGDRAAQFSPFAALTGFEAALGETGRITESRPEPEDYGKEILDQALLQLQALLPLRPQVTITYFEADQKKDGGAYASVYGQVRKIDLYRQIIVMLEGTEIPLHDIVQIEGAQFAEL